ncbi:MAG: PD-(D/E)XK nuclease family protein, partial [Burkholderiaceae bacterium]
MHLSRCVVLLPYAQLMPVARRYWAQVYPSGFVPQFQTTQNWASQVRGFALDANDISFEAARDVLTAASLVEQSGLVGSGTALDTDQRDLLAQQLVEAAHQLASAAAAIAPDQRLAWATQMRETVFSTNTTASFTATFQWLRWESALARLALAWASTSAYATDVLFDDRLAKSKVDCLMVLEGFQRDPLVQALANHWEAQAVLLPQLEVIGSNETTPAEIQLHKALDAQDEAQRAAACVLRHIEAGRVPVALAATDRALTRRIRAMLATQDVAVKDENGWKLSTTRAASHIMVCLSACAWNASSDSMLDWLKNSSFATAIQIQTLEKELRRAGITRWQAWVQAALAAAESVEATEAQRAAQATAVLIDTLRAPLQKPRTLAAWLFSLRATLQASGQWTRLQDDLAGEKVLTVLHLNEGGEQAYLELPQAQRRLSLAEFKDWVDMAMESSSFVPLYPPGSQEAQVVIVPMSQLLARPFAAAVLPGCDEVRFNPSPDLPGLWSAAERKGLGLTTRDEQDAATRAAWLCALQTPVCDVLWRQTESTGEPLLASALVQSLALRLGLLGLQQPTSTATDPRSVRQLEAAPTPKPMPKGDKLPVKRLSSSAYDKLRTCPYQFFALQQLGLQENDELEDELGKRDFGLWLHAVLSHFHESLKNEINRGVASDFIAKTALLNIASEAVTQSMNLPADAFLPWAATWPKVRDGYVNWLSTHEAQGWQFDQSEVSKRMPLGR